jgi:sugar lactone lactonase YvrE
VFRVDPDAGTFEQVASTGGFCLGLAFGPDGALYVCDQKHAAVMRVDVASGEVAEFAREPAMRIPNFPAFDAAGRLYVSDSFGEGAGPGIFRFEPDGSGELWHAGPFRFANGLALATDGSALYLAETWAHRVLRLAIGADGSPGEVSTLAELGRALPDGLALAVDGSVWVGCYEPSEVLRIDASGALSTVVADPTAHLLCHPTNLAFRGTEVITANLGRWHLTAIDAGIEGVPVPLGGLA